MDNGFHKLFNKGKIRVLSKLNEKQRTTLHVNSYKLYKIVPFIVAFYNAKMNAVDLIDQYVSSHERYQRQYKWSIFIQLLKWHQVHPIRFINSLLLLI